MIKVGECIAMKGISVMVAVGARLEGAGLLHSRMEGGLYIHLTIAEANFN